MKSEKPFFSVVIPTYNRAHLLPFALRSILQQTFEDFEIIISNGGSTDNTSAVIKSFQDPRIRYFESYSRLPVGDNYQNGLNHAMGKYITFLSDDDAYTPNLLETVLNIIKNENAEIVGYPYARYYHESLNDSYKIIPANSIVIPKFTGKITKFDSISSLEQILSISSLGGAEIDPNFICPYLSNAMYDRRIFETLLSHRKNLFDMVPPDMYLAAAVFYVAKAYHCVDMPLLVWSNWPGNFTASADHVENKVRQHYERLLGDRTLENVPLKFALPSNCGANAILEAVKDLGNYRPNVKPDWPSYFAKTYRSIIFLRSTGVNTTEEEAEYRLTLAKQPTALQHDVRKLLSNAIFRFKVSLVSRLPRLANWFRQKLRGRDSETILKGSEYGFSNVVEAATFVHSKSNQ